MVSVATHLPADEIAAYAREVMRLLAPGGRLFLTAFLVTARGHDAPEGPPAFLEGRGGRQLDMPIPPRRWAPSASINGIVEDDSSTDAGLQIRRVSFGHWRGIESTHYQDIIVAVKPEDGRLTTARPRRRA